MQHLGSSAVTQYQFREGLPSRVERSVHRPTDWSLRPFGQGRSLGVPDFDDPEQEAKDHGNFIDEGVAEVEREADEAAGGQDHRPAGTADEHAEKKIAGQKGTGTPANNRS
jgi:hypothetical protein